MYVFVVQSYAIVRVRSRSFEMVYSYSGGTFTIAISSVAGGNTVPPARLGCAWLGCARLAQARLDFVLRKARLRKFFSQG